MMLLERRRLLINTKKSLLPSEYQQVEYIECTGRQYIDTEYLPTGQLRVDGIVNVPEPTTELAVVGTSSQGWELGFTAVTSTRNRFFSYLVPSNFGSIAVVPESSIYNTMLQFSAINDKNQSFRSLSLNVDNAYIESTVINANYRLKLYLFNYRNVYYFTGKCYNIKIYDDDILMRDFIPCYRKSDNEIGMYDVINNVFYTNSGTGKFLKGGDI